MRMLGNLDCRSRQTAWLTSRKPGFPFRFGPRNPAFIVVSANTDSYNLSNCCYIIENLVVWLFDLTEFGRTKYDEIGDGQTR